MFEKNGLNENVLLKYRQSITPLGIKMVRTINVTLEWSLFVRPEDIPMRAGIYMVIAGRKDENGSWEPSTYKLLDIGQSGETGDRLPTHEREPCWKKEKPPNTDFLYKFAIMPSEKYDEEDRRIAECCLRAHTKPPCGSECNDGYNRKDTVSITNASKPAPLSEKYSCP